MNNKGQLNSKEIRIQGLLDSYLRTSAANKELAPATDHLDEDSLTAFVEGNLDENEAKPMVSHLADCSFCRHVSAELIKLDVAFVDEVEPAAVINEDPASVGSVLSGILSRIFGTNEAAVFAHNEEEDEKKKESKSEEE